jgi:putative ABC transport system permease protein
VLKMIVRQAGVLVMAGIAIGLAGATAVGATLRSLLFEISPHDPVTLAAIAVGLAAVAFVAAFIPARRATRVDPLVALRVE